MAEQRIRPLTACLALALVGCAANARRLAPSPGQDAAMDQWFENVMVKAPPLIDSHWTRAEQEELMQRVGHADAAAVGTIEVVSRISYYQRKRRVGLLFRPLEVLHGRLPQETLPLSLSAGQVDFNVALLLDDASPPRRLYLLLVKRKPARPSFRWVLYRPDALLIQQVRGMYISLARRQRG